MIITTKTIANQMNQGIELKAITPIPTKNRGNAINKKAKFLIKTAKTPVAIAAKTTPSNTTITSYKEDMKFPQLKHNL